jgi:pimeloyl-ACP methyl ester carboxylesterase
MDAGEGSPVVMLHGFGGMLEVWLPVEPALLKQHRVVTVDLKGFGWSDRAEGDYSPQGQAQRVFALMDRLKIPQAAVVAHSYGASVAMAMAMAAPQRVTRLALISAFVYSDEAFPFSDWYRVPGFGEALMALSSHQRPDELIELSVYDKKLITQPMVDAATFMSHLPGAAAAALATLRAQNFEAIESRYPLVRQPTLILWGREDAITPIWFAERLSRELLNARLVVYPQCGHVPMFEASASTSTELARFLGDAS